MVECILRSFWAKDCLPDVLCHLHGLCLLGRNIKLNCNADRDADAEWRRSSVSASCWSRYYSRSLGGERARTSDGHLLSWPSVWSFNCTNHRWPHCTEVELEGHIVDTCHLWRVDLDLHPLCFARDVEIKEKSGRRSNG